MISGLITQQSFPNLLRDTAQKRKNGELEIGIADGPLKIFFLSGKIVDYQIGEASRAQETFTLLKRTGDIEKDAIFQGTDYLALEKAILIYCGGDSHIAKQMIKRAISKRTIDYLHSLKFEASVPWKFKVGGVDIERSLIVPVVVSQLLLDFSDLEGVTKEFNETFAPDSKVRLGIIGVEPNSEGELIAEKIGAGGTSVTSLLDSVLLPTHYIRSLMVSMLEEGAIEIGANIPDTKSTIEIPVHKSEPGDSLGLVPDLMERLERSTWIPNLIAILFFLAAIICPFFFWEGAFMLF